MAQQPKTETEAEYMTEAQYCALVHINPKTAQRQRVAGDGPPWVRASKTRVLYRRVDVNAWLASRTFKHRAAEATNRPVAA